eukprot:Gb_08252 [translate_table: standard]
MGSQMVQDTVKKVDQAMARLQELQCTVAGGSKVCGGVNLSPRSTRGYLRTSLRCKQESLRMRELAMKVAGETNADQGQHCDGSSSSALIGELRRSSSIGEWRRWSMPAVLIQQAMGEIVEASNLAKEVAYFVSSPVESKPFESPKTPQSSLNGKSLAGRHGKQGSDRKYVLGQSERANLDEELKTQLQKSKSNKPENVVHKFRMLAKDLSSTLKSRRKLEKQEFSVREKVELPEAGVRVRRQMSFRVSDRPKVQGGTPVSQCSSPARAMGEETSSSAKPLVKVEQIRPAHKPWMSRCRSTKAIMFPNPAFTSSPPNHWENSLRSMGASMRRKSLPSLEYLASSKATEPSPPICMEEGPMACNMETSLKLWKSSSFSEAYGSNASKLTKQSSMPSVLNRTIKQTHVSKPCTASDSTENPSSMSVSHKVPAKFQLIPSQEKIESLKLLSSSNKEDWLGRRHSLSSYDPPAICNISQLSRQPIESLVQPVPSRWPSRKRQSSSIMHPKPNTKAEDVASKNTVFKGAGAMHNQVEPILCEKRQRETPLLIADAVKKEGNSLIGDNSSKSSILKTAKISVNEIPNRRNVLSRSHSLRCPKQSLLRPIDVNCDYDIFNNSDSNMDTFKEQCMRKKDILQRKENRDYSKECKVEGSDVMAKKSSRFLRSWSFRLDNKTLPDNRKLNNNGTGRSSIPCVVCLFGGDAQFQSAYSFGLEWIEHCWWVVLEDKMSRHIHSKYLVHKH